MRLIPDQCGTEVSIRRVRNILTDKRAVDYNITRASAAKSATVWYKITSDTFIEHLAAKTYPGRALRFWIVGEVAHDGAWLMRSGGGDLFKRVSIRVKPVVDGEYDIWNSHLSAFGEWKGMCSLCPEHIPFHPPNLIQCVQPLHAMTTRTGIKGISDIAGRSSGLQNMWMGLGGSGCNPATKRGMSCAIFPRFPIRKSRRNHCTSRVSHSVLNGTLWRLKQHETNYYC